MKKSLVNVFKVKSLDEGSKRKTTKIFFVENYLKENGEVEKKIRIQKKPLYTFHTSKPEYRNKLNVTFIENYKNHCYNIRD